MPVALAHPSFETRSAVVGASYKAVIKIPHGCDGSPTTRVRVLIPEGVIGVKPKPMPGWSIETKRGAYERSYKFYHGAVLTEGVKEIVWSGKLPDEYLRRVRIRRVPHRQPGGRNDAAFPGLSGLREGCPRLGRRAGAGAGRARAEIAGAGHRLAAGRRQRPSRANLQGRDAGDRGALGARNAGRRAGRRRLHEDHQHRQGSRSADRRVAADCRRGRGARNGHGGRRHENAPPGRRAGDQARRRPWN